MFDIKQMINCYRCPLPFMTMYQGDIVQDTIEALEDLDELTDDDGSDVREVFNHLPDDDEFDDIIDVLENALEMNKQEIIAGIEKALELIVAKRDEYTRTRQELQEEYKIE